MIGEFLPEACLLEAAKDHLGTLDDKARVAMRELSERIENAKRDAFEAGMDFAHGPVSIERPDPFEVRDIWAPQRLTASVPGGPVERSFAAPHNWTVYRNPEYRGPK